jgi:hypothetical protein
LSQRCLPFGEFWYAAVFCDILPAFAVIVVPSIVAAAPAAQAALLNRYRREISPAQRIAMTLSLSFRLFEACEYANSINYTAHRSKELRAQPYLLERPRLNSSFDDVANPNLPVTERLKAYPAVAVRRQVPSKSADRGPLHNVPAAL